jgi:hypothetical protein
MSSNYHDVTLDAFVRRIAREAEKCFDRHGEIPLTWFYEIPGDGLGAMVTPVDLDTKDQLADRMRSLFWEKRVTRYAFVTEGWAATTPGWTGPAVNDPQRVELVLIYAEDGREAISAKRDIIRPAHSKPYLAKLEIEHGASRSGRFANLLAPTRGGPAPRMSDELKVKIRDWAREHGDRFYIGSVIEQVEECPDGGAKFNIDTRAFADHQSAIDGAADALDGEELVWARAGWTAIAMKSRRTWVIARVEASTMNVSLGYVAPTH